jgi:toxin HigB-1
MAEVVLDANVIIRVNAQWRIVFRWTPDGPAEVDVRDYH